MITNNCQWNDGSMEHRLRRSKTRRHARFASLSKGYDSNVLEWIDGKGTAMNSVGNGGNGGFGAAVSSMASVGGGTGAGG